MPLFPPYRWGQTSDAVVLTLTGVNEDGKAECAFDTEERFVMKSSRHELELELFATIDANKSKIVRTGRDLRVVLHKREKASWAFLQKPNRPRPPTEKVDWDFVDADDSDNDEKPAPVFQNFNTGEMLQNPSDVLQDALRSQSTQHTVGKGSGLFSFASYDYLFFSVGLLCIILAPFNKVEESFNTQAIHDILFHRSNIDLYDHHEFPGVVPRTFLGALAVSIVASPLHFIVQWMGLSKLASLMIARMVLLAFVTAANAAFRSTLRHRFGESVANTYQILLLCQFHTVYYASRTLPNTFAFAIVLVSFSWWIRGFHRKCLVGLTAATVIFRSEIAALAFPVVVAALVRGKIHLWRAVWRCGIAAAAALALTVAVDSALWRRWLWPEGEVLYFNTALNQSHRWGRMPPLWYFTSALPRAMTISYLLLPIGLVQFRKKLAPYVLPALAFIALYSLLPHKEVRFILYVFPVLTLPAAMHIADARKKSHVLWRIYRYGLYAGIALALCVTAFGAAASARNYPGGEALMLLQAREKQETASVHIGTKAAMEGVSRFLEMRQNWRYWKTEGAIRDEDYDFLLREDGEERHGFQLLFSVTGLDRMQFIPPAIQTSPKIFVFKRVSNDGSQVSDEAEED